MEKMMMAEDTERLKKAKQLLALGDPQRAKDNQEAVDR
jgi:hypothetical protein